MERRRKEVVHTHGNSPLFFFGSLLCFSTLCQRACSLAPCLLNTGQESLFVEGGIRTHGSRSGRQAPNGTMYQREAPCHCTIAAPYTPFICVQIVSLRPYLLSLPRFAGNPEDSAVTPCTVRFPLHSLRVSSIRASNFLQKAWARMRQTKR
jgi:hypothetical protein